MQIYIKGKEFDVEIAGEHPGYIALIPLTNALEKKVPIATGRTKAETINNAIEYLIALVEMEEEDAGCTAKE